MKQPYAKEELKTLDDVAVVDDIEVLEGEVIIDNDGRRILRMVKSISNVDFTRTLDKIAQFVNLTEVAGTIKKGSQYVVQIPAEFQKLLETHQLFINQNKTTGVEWPTLVKRLDNGKQEFVAPLPIKRQDFIQGDPFRDFCDSYHNIAMQKQLEKIAMKVEETYEMVKIIEQGQQDDRIALIDVGKKQIQLSMLMKDDDSKRSYLNNGVYQMQLGREQIGKAMVRRIEAFKELPQNRVALFIYDLTRPGYLNKKDDEIEIIQDCYSMYVDATKMIAATLAYVGETDAAEQTFVECMKFLGEIDFSKLRSIEASHKDAKFDDWFFNKPVEYAEMEMKPCLEIAKEYDCFQIEVSGEELLEVLQNERNEISEKKIEQERS